jgi:hypothetical protein
MPKCSELHGYAKNGSHTSKHLHMRFTLPRVTLWSKMTEILPSTKRTQLFGVDVVTRPFLSNRPFLHLFQIHSLHKLPSPAIYIQPALEGCLDFEHIVSECSYNFQMGNNCMSPNNPFVLHLLINVTNHVHYTQSFDRHTNPLQFQWSLPNNCVQTELLICLGSMGGRESELLCAVAKSFDTVWHWSAAEFHPEPQCHCITKTAWIQSPSISLVLLKTLVA